MSTGVPNERAPLNSRWRWFAMLAVVLAIGAALRFPGVTWGFDLDTSPYQTAHPDEGVACLSAMLRGVPEMKNNDPPQERGMMFQCLALGLVFKPHDVKSAAQIGRVYSVLWGLIGILLVALITRRLRGEVAAILAALLLATSGIHLVTSFWARGQVQNVAFTLASMLVALRTQTSSPRGVINLFIAAALAGAAIATRWTIALIPMLLACAVARGPVFQRIGAGAAGGLFGFFASTGFFWTPDQIASNLEMQKQNLVTLYSRMGPFVIGSAALVCMAIGTGLVTFLLAGWFAVDRARDLRRPRRQGFAWSALRSKLDSPGMIIGFPTAITFALLCNNGLFDARYTDLFAPPLAIAAGIKMAEIWRSPRWRVAVVALAVYQGVYATSILSRYVNDTRKDMNAALDQVWRPRGTIYASMYANNSPLYAGHGLAPGQGPWDAEWMAVADGYAGMYLTPSGTFRFLRPPLSCREIIYCEGERMREFYQQLYDGNGWDLVHVSKAAAWTPEIKLHHALMMSKWLFSGDIRLYRRRQPAN